MIAGNALAAWLSDRGAQRRSQVGVETSAGHWSRQPLFADLGRRIAENPGRSAADLVALARGFMDQEEAIAALMTDLLASSAADPFFHPPFYPTSSEIHTGLILYTHPDMMLTLGITGVDMLAAKKAGPRGATSIAFTGLTTLFRYVKAGGATVSFWEADPIGSDFVAGQAGQARLTGRRRLEDGEEILIDGRYQSFIIEHAARDMVYFQALIRPGQAPLATEYDSKTLSLVGSSSTDEAASRVQMMVSLLRTMGRDDAFPLIEESLNSPHFYTRWHIMREMLAMDADAALPALRRMAAGDPHPEVRAAAQQTLGLFFADADETEAEEPAACHA